MTHDVGLVKMLCDRAMLLYRGRTLALGDPSDVVNRYNGLVLERQREFAEANPPPGPEQPAAERSEPGAEPLVYSFRHGDRQAEVVRVELLNQAGKPARAFCSGESMRVRVEVRFREPHPRPVVGIMIRTRIGMEVYGTNTELEQAGPGPAGRGDLIEVTFEFACRLTAQEYTLTVAAIARRHEPRLARRRAGVPGGGHAARRRRGQSRSPRAVPQAAGPLPDYCVAESAKHREVPF